MLLSYLCNCGPTINIVIFLKITQRHKSTATGNSKLTCLRHDLRDNPDRLKEMAYLSGALLYDFLLTCINVQQLDIRGSTTESC